MENHTIFFSLIGCFGILILIFLFMAKLLMPYSKGMLLWLNKLSRKSVFVKGFTVLFIILYSMILVAPLFTGVTVQVRDLLIGLGLGVLAGIVSAGIFISVLRYSYEYIVDGDNEKK